MQLAAGLGLLAEPGAMLLGFESITCSLIQDAESHVSCCPAGGARRVLLQSSAGALGLGAHTAGRHRGEQWRPGAAHWPPSLPYRRQRCPPLLCASHVPSLLSASSNGLHKPLWVSGQKIVKAQLADLLAGFLQVHRGCTVASRCRGGATFLHVSSQVAEPFLVYRR